MEREKTWLDHRWQEAYAVFAETTKNVNDEETYYDLLCSEPIVAERFADYCVRSTWQPVA